MTGSNNATVVKVAARLRAARKAAGYKTARAFASQFQIPESTYSQRETGKRALTADIMLEYCELFKINPAWLLTGSGEPRTDSDHNKTIKILQATQAIDNAPIQQYCPEITRQSVVKMDMTLWCDILAATQSIPDEVLNDYDDHTDFYIEIYNSIITTSADTERRREMIKLSVNSLKRGMTDNYKEVAAAKEG